MNTLKNVKTSSGRQLNRVVISWQDFDCESKRPNIKAGFMEKNGFLFLSKHIKPNNDLIT